MPVLLCEAGPLCMVKTHLPLMQQLALISVWIKYNWQILTCRVITKTDLLLCSQDREENDSNQNSSSVQGKCPPGNRSRCVALRGGLGTDSERRLCSCPPQPDPPKCTECLQYLDDPELRYEQHPPDSVSPRSVCSRVVPSPASLLTGPCLSGGRDTDTDQREVVHL